MIQQKDKEKKAENFPLLRKKLSVRVSVWAGKQNESARSPSHSRSVLVVPPGIEPESKV